VTAEDDVAVAAHQAAEVAALDADAALRTAIGARVAALRAAADVATTDQAKAASAATAETATAAAVKASTPAVTVPYLTLVRDQVAQIHTMLAEMYAWRTQMDAGYALAVNSTADLATVVASKL
jgi:hypothetical protein